MQDKFSGAVTLGYASLFISLWLFFMPFAGWTSFSSAEAALPFILVLGGVVLAIAGIFSFLNDAKIESVVFFIMAAANFSFSLRFIMWPKLQANTAFSPVDGWTLFLVAVVFFYLWIASFKGNTVRQLFLLGLWLAFLAGAIANWFSISIFAYISGYLGLITSLLAGWYSASMVKNIGNQPQPIS